MWNRTQISNGNNDEHNENIAEVETGGLVGLDIFHSLIHHGYFHNVQFKKSGQNTDDVSNITFTVPTTTSTNKRAGIHARIDAKVVGGIAISIQDVASYTGGNAKTPMLIFMYMKDI